MGKHELPDEHGTSDESDVPGLHEKHRAVRIALNSAMRLTRDVMAGGASIVIFEWFRVVGVAMPASHHSEALVEVIRYVSS